MKKRYLLFYINISFVKLWVVNWSVNLRKVFKVVFSSFVLVITLGNNLFCLICDVRLELDLDSPVVGVYIYSNSSGVLFFLFFINYYYNN